MPQTVEAIYHEGVVEPKHTRKSSVDTWIGILQGADLGDWKTNNRERRYSALSYLQPLNFELLPLAA